MKLFIKNMVCIRCKMVVKATLEDLGLAYTVVELGEIEIRDILSSKTHSTLKIALNKFGLELMDDHKAVMVEKIKNVIIEMVHYSEKLPNIKFSCYLSEKLNYDYTYISNLFSEVKGISIEQFIIAHKIERVKELLVYNELSIKEIASKLSYSSESHLSGQFKKVTGLTPSYFKKMKLKKFISLESL